MGARDSVAAERGSSCIFSLPCVPFLFSATEATPVSEERRQRALQQERALALAARTTIAAVCERCARGTVSPLTWPAAVPGTAVDSRGCCAVRVAFCLLWSLFSAPRLSTPVAGRLRPTAAELGPPPPRRREGGGAVPTAVAGVADQQSRRAAAAAGSGIGACSRRCRMLMGKVPASLPPTRPPTGAAPHRSGGHQRWNDRVQAYWCACVCAVSVCADDVRLVRGFRAH